MLAACGTTAPQPGDPCSVFKCQNGAMIYHSDGGIGGTATHRSTTIAPARITDRYGRTTGYIK